MWFYVCWYSAGSHLFLIGAGDQSAELTQTVVDPVPAPFLNDLRKNIKSLLDIYEESENFNQLSKILDFFFGCF